MEDKTDSMKGAIFAHRREVSCLGGSLSLR